VGLQFAVEAEGSGWFRVSALRGDERVSWLHVVELDVHYGASKVRVGGVAGVYTPREHRGRGYSAATLRYAVQWMRERGYPLTALFGIPEYYHRFGYATFMGEHTVTLSLRSASRVEAEELDWEVSDDQGAWRGEISRIYEAVNTLWPGARVREPSSWDQEGRILGAPGEAARAEALGEGRGVRRPRAGAEPRGAAGSRRRR